MRRNRGRAMTEPSTGTEEDLAAPMRLRADPPRVTRLSRKVLAGLGLVAGLGIGGAGARGGLALEQVGRNFARGDEIGAGGGGAILGVEPHRVGAVADEEPGHGFGTAFLLECPVAEVETFRKPRSEEVHEPERQGRAPDRRSERPGPQQAQGGGGRMGRTRQGEIDPAAALQEGLRDPQPVPRHRFVERRRVPGRDIAVGVCARIEKGMRRPDIVGFVLADQGHEVPGRPRAAGTVARRHHTSSGSRPTRPASRATVSPWTMIENRTTT